MEPDVGRLRTLSDDGERCIVRWTVDDFLWRVERCTSFFSENFYFGRLPFYLLVDKNIGYCCANTHLKDKRNVCLKGPEEIEPGYRYHRYRCNCVQCGSPPPEYSTMLSVVDNNNGRILIKKFPGRKLHLGFPEDVTKLLNPDGSLSILCEIWIIPEGATNAFSPFLQNSVAPAGESRASNSFPDNCQMKDKDVTIVVQGHEFRTFMFILRVRAPVFASEITEKLKNTENSTVDISDLCSSATFQPFMDFITTGRVEKPLTSDTAFELYVMADKYKLEDLKEHCIENKNRPQTFVQLC